MHLSPSHVPPIDPAHVWFATTKDIREQVDGVIDDCMVRGKSGWPPHTGGQGRFTHSFGKPCPHLLLTYLSTFPFPFPTPCHVHVHVFSSPSSSNNNNNHQQFHQPPITFARDRQTRRAPPGRSLRHARLRQILRQPRPRRRRRARGAHARGEGLPGLVLEAEKAAAATTTCVPVPC